MKKRIAIFPAGSEIGLEINNALKYSTHLEIYGFNSVKDHSEYVFKNYVSGLPFYNKKNFIKEFNKKIIENNIDFIYPAHDDILLFLTENNSKIKAEIITSELETVRITRSKLKTYKYFNEEDFIPKVYKSKKEIEKFPIFIKPDVGQGSKGAKIINNEKQLDNAIYENSEIVMVEYLPGEEYTIDCFTNFKGELLIIKQRNRNRIRMGISVNSCSLELDKTVEKMAREINKKLKFNGSWFFQLKKDKENRYKLLEIAPRVSGTMGLNRNLGTNYELLSIFNKMGKEIKIINNQYSIEVDRAFISRYKLNFEYEYIYVDLDDTLILNNKVNKYLIMFLYGATEKKIILISKHISDIQKTLEKYKISLKLFDEIIHLNKDQEKSDFIKYRNSIFIDDSFSERIKISENLKIPVFDVSEVECLLDWKV